MWPKFVDWLTLGITARIRAEKAAWERLNDADALIQRMREEPRPWVFVEYINPADLGMVAFLANVQKDRYWRAFLAGMRERFVRQLLESARTSGESKDLHTGALIALDLINAEMSKASAENERLKTHGSDSNG